MHCLQPFHAITRKKNNPFLSETRTTGEGKGYSLAQNRAIASVIPKYTLLFAAILALNCSCEQDYYPKK